MVNGYADDGVTANNSDGTVRPGLRIRVGIMPLEVADKSHLGINARRTWMGSRTLGRGDLSVLHATYIRMLHDGRSDRAPAR